MLAVLIDLALVLVGLELVVLVAVGLVMVGVLATGFETLGAVEAFFVREATTTGPVFVGSEVEDGEGEVVDFVTA